MADTRDTTDDGMGGALREIFGSIDDALKRLHEGGPDTKDRISIYITEALRAAQLDNREKDNAMKDASRSIWGALTRIAKAVSDDSIDKQIQNYVDGNRRKKR